VIVATGEGGDGVRDDQRCVAEGDAIAEPEQEADEQDLLVADRDARGRTVGTDGADLQERSQGHRDAPGGRSDCENGDHEAPFGEGNAGGTARRSVAEVAAFSILAVQRQDAQEGR